jgi:hypothetical protein
MCSVFSQRKTINMDGNKNTQEILLSLTQGKNPFDGKQFEENHICNDIRIVRALSEALHQFDTCQGNSIVPKVFGNSATSPRTGLVFVAPKGVVRSPKEELKKKDFPKKKAFPKGPKPANAGEKWTKELNEEVKLAYESGESIVAIAKEQGRTPKAIRSRLIKLGVIDDEYRANPKTQVFREPADSAEEK